MKADLAAHLRRAAVLMLIVGAVAGCGRKGSLEPAAGETAKTGTEEGAQPAQPQQGGISQLRAKKPPPVLPKKEPSILDPILE